MRENMGLYRGKEKPNGEWVEGFLVDAQHIGNWVEANPVDPETVGQFTGLTDIGGKRIFEGDILKTAVTGIAPKTGAVLYQDGAFGLRCTDGAALFLCFVSGSCTVIGNIHDNPELLTKNAAIDSPLDKP